MSSLSRLVFALCQMPCDPELHREAAQSHVERLWRAYGGDWCNHEVASAFLGGVAQLAWRCARRDDCLCAPPFTVALATEPRCVRVLLPDDTRHFGVVIVWLRHFETLLPPGSPSCDLVLAPKGGWNAVPLAAQWLWGRRPANVMPEPEHFADTVPARPRDLSCRIDRRETLV